MTYPIFNLYPKWKEDIIQEFIRYDNLYRLKDMDFFKTYFLGQTFVDSEGKLYVLDSVKDYTFSKFCLFKSRKKILHFRPLEKSLTFEELKFELQKRANTLKLDIVKQDFIELLDSVNNIKDLLSKM